MSNPSVDLPEPDSAGEDDELVLGDGQGDVFQVVQPGAANGDLISHLTSRNINMEMAHSPSPY